MRDLNGQLRTFEYDALNRQTHERWIGTDPQTNGQTVIRDIRSAYDAGNQLTWISIPLRLFPQPRLQIRQGLKLQQRFRQGFQLPQRQPLNVLHHPLRHVPHPPGQ